MRPDLDDRPLFLDKNDRLGRRYLKPLSAPHVFAHQHIVNPDHVIFRLLILSPIVVVIKTRGVFLFGPFQPPNFVVRTLTAVRARVVRGLYFLLFVEYVAFLHIASILAYADRLAGLISLEGLAGI